MSLGREILRNGIRTFAAPALLIYIVLVNWPKVKDKPGIQKLITTYTKLWQWIKTKAKKPETQDEWTYKKRNK